MTQAQIDNFVNSAGCWLAKENAKLIRAEWRGEDTSCKWRELTLLMHRIDAIQRGALAGETLYETIEVTEATSLAPLANNTAPSAVVTKTITDSTTGKEQDIDATLVGGKTTLNGILDTVKVTVGSDDFFEFRPITSYQDIYNATARICSFYGLDLNAGSYTGSQFTLSEKIDPSQYRSATNNSGEAKNATPISVSATFNYSFEQCDYDWDVSGSIAPGDTVISITKFTVDGGTLGTVVYNFASPLDPFDANSVIDGLSDIFGVDRVQYATNGSPTGYTGVGKIEMSELFSLGPSSFITYSVDTGGGPVDIDVPLVVDILSLGNGVKTFDLKVNTSGELSGGSRNTTNDNLQAQWTCVIAGCDGADELQSINISGTEIPFTTPFTMSSDVAIGAWLTANASAGTFSSSWSGTSLTISRTSSEPGLIPRNIKWRRVVAPAAAAQDIIGVNKFVPNISASNSSSFITVDEYTSPDTYGREYILYWDSTLKDNLYLAEYYDGIQRDSQLVYTATNPGEQVYAKLFFDSVNNWIMAVIIDSPTAGPVNVNLYRTDSSLGPMVLVGNMPTTGSLIDASSVSIDVVKNLANGSYFISVISRTLGVSIHEDIYAYDNIFQFVAPVYVNTELTAATGGSANIVFDPTNNYLWHKFSYMASSSSIVCIDAFTYAPVGSYVISSAYPGGIVVTGSAKMSAVSVNGNYYLSIPCQDTALTLVPVVEFFDLSILDTDLAMTNLGVPSSSFFTSIKQVGNNKILLCDYFPGTKTYLLDSDGSIIGDIDPGIIVQYESEIFYNPAIQQYTFKGSVNGVGVGTPVVYCAEATYGAFQPSDQHTPFNVGLASLFSSTSTPVVASDDNQCLTDAERVALTSDIRKTSSGCCGGGASGSQFSQSPVAIIRGVTANEYIDANGDPLRA